MDIIYHCFSIFFFYYLFNNSDILLNFRTWVFLNVGDSVTYALQCSFCFTWWASLMLFAYGFCPFIFVFVAPVINLFLYKILTKLNNTDNPIP
jgi:hypothetical protein